MRHSQSGGKIIQRFELSHVSPFLSEPHYNTACVGEGLVRSRLFWNMATILSKAEKSYILTSLTSSPPLRQDGRGPLDYRVISVVTGDEVASLANGSGKVRVGGTEVVSAVRLEVEDLTNMDARKGRIRCNVTW